jgi:Ca2+-binding EF-hand superfamily protein
VLIDELVNSDDQLEDMRAKFKEYDTDYSGFLTVDEFYACLLSMGVDVNR